MEESSEKSHQKIINTNDPAIYNALPEKEKKYIRKAKLINAFAFGIFVFAFLYILLNIFFELHFIGIILPPILFYITFKYVYKNFEVFLDNDSRRFTRKLPTDWDPGDMNDPRNPFAFTTPGSPYYAFDHIDHNQSQTSSSAFSDSDRYYNR